ncbi:hypothetical protein ACA910_012280 [Epithemia clementina (nom. ined.)]
MMVTTKMTILETLDLLQSKLSQAPRKLPQRPCTITTLGTTLAIGSTAQTSTDNKLTEEASSTAPASSAANVDDAKDNNFGGFGSAPGDTNVEAANPISLSSNNAVGTTNGTAEPGVSHNNNNDNDDNGNGFGDFGSAAPMSNTTTPEAQDGTSTTQAGVSTITDTVAVSLAITITAAQENNDFGDFGWANEAMSESNQAADPPKQVNSDDDKDFGDFDLAPKKPKIDESGVTAGATKSDENNDDGNDFGDFGSAAPTMASAVLLLPCWRSQKRIN